jgi:hypothetical protein
MGSHVRFFAWSLLTAVGLAALACGGRVDPSDDGGASGSSSGSGGSGGSSSGSTSGGGSGSGFVVPPCPPDPPSPGMSCTAPGQEGCAYYTNGGCEAFLCNDSSVWQTTPEGC